MRRLLLLGVRLAHRIGCVGRAVLRLVLVSVAGLLVGVGCGEGGGPSGGDGGGGPLNSGTGRSDENGASAWSGVRDCLVESGVGEFDEIPPTGQYMPPEVMPLNFGDAPGGWLIAHMNGDQELSVFFYDSAAEAEHAKDEAPHFPDATAVSRNGSVLYGFRASPTPEQVDIAEHCVALPTS